ncbi:uncharacterized protein VP01_1529g4 [Puccinia sorghi]|uniref:DUF659 domain-containing protein n=1 Tax=Puccinia sorghi TaxID=27349 RepID=A0A0L6VIJ6_9BASI|nr:uncharacterized protein VP01_1529g4 [Puccinia sorghi]
MCIRYSLVSLRETARLIFPGGPILDIHHSTFSGGTDNKIQLSEDPSQPQPEKSVVKVINLDDDATNNNVLARQSSLKRFWVWESLQRFLRFLGCSLSKGLIRQYQEFPQASAEETPPHTYIFHVWLYCSLSSTAKLYGRLYRKEVVHRPPTLNKQTSWPYDQPNFLTMHINPPFPSEFISFTQDAWTAPNVTAFMGITAHFIDNKYKMVNLTISIPHVQGMILFSHFCHYIILILFVGTHNFRQNSGKNFAKLFYEAVQIYSCLEKLHTITADNASTNGKMAQELSTIIPHFHMNTHLLGCIAHVINLGQDPALLF